MRRLIGLSQISGSRVRVLPFPSFTFQGEGSSVGRAADIKHQYNKFFVSLSSFFLKGKHVHVVDFTIELTCLGCGHRGTSRTNAIYDPNYVRFYPNTFRIGCLGCRKIIEIIPPYWSPTEYDVGVFHLKITY